MDRMRDLGTWRDDFIGGSPIPTSLTAGCPWKATDTSAAGTPTFAPLSPSATGEIQMQFSNTNEVQNLCLDFGDVLCLDIDNLQSIAFGLRVTGTLNAATRLAFGLQSARNDSTDSTTNNCQFLLAGSNALLVETDDNTTDVDDIATGLTLTTALHRFVIDFTGGKSNIKFYGGRLAGSLTSLATSRTFSMTSTGSLQPFVQIQKTASTNTDGVFVDYVEIEYKRF